MATHLGRGRKSREVSAQEALARYDYLLDTLPRSIVDSAHRAVVGELASEQQAALNEAMARADDPSSMREAVASAGALEQVARQFVMTGPVKTYFSSGAGSVTIDEQPPWVSELVHHDGAPVDAGTMNHRKGVNSGVWF